MLPINRRRIAQSLVICTPLLTGCVGGENSPPNLALNFPSPKVQEALRPACGTPTQWDKKTRGVVADFLDMAAAEPGAQALGAEWERLNDQVKICRSEDARDSTNNR